MSFFSYHLIHRCTNHSFSCHFLFLMLIAITGAEIKNKRTRTRIQSFFSLKRVLVIQKEKTKTNLNRYRPHFVNASSYQYYSSNMWNCAALIFRQGRLTERPTTLLFCVRSLSLSLSLFKCNDAMAAAVVYISFFFFFYALVETVQGMPWHVMPEF